VTSPRTPRFSSAPRLSSSYTTVKTVISGTGGALKTTTKATKDGYYRYVFAGTTTTGSATAAGDYIDVQ
jgi:hypothetical protein